MGAVLTPSLSGVESRQHLPNASTFCGKCESVCPMRIPLPKHDAALARAQFAQALDPPVRALGHAAWAFAAAPELYHARARLAARLLGRLGRGPAVSRAAARRRLDRTREMPAPEGRTFQAIWRAQGPGERGARADARRLRRALGRGAAPTRARRAIAARAGRTPAWCRRAPGSTGADWSRCS